MGNKMKLAAFDLEIAKELDELDDWQNHAPLGITCAAIALIDTDEVTYWGADPQLSQEQSITIVHALQDLVENGYLLLTWNGAAFDFQILAQESGLFEECGELAMNHVDMMLLVTFQKGYYLSLEKALTGAGLKGKLKHVVLSNGETVENMTGSKAPQLWTDKEFDAVLQYLGDDVRQTLQLGQSVRHSCQIMWRSNRGNPMHVSVKNLDPVWKCFNYPEPDTSWMTDSPDREKFVSWIPDWFDKLSNLSVAQEIYNELQPPFPADDCIPPEYTENFDTYDVGYFEEEIYNELHPPPPSDDCIPPEYTENFDTYDVGFFGEEIYNELHPPPPSDDCIPSEHTEDFDPYDVECFENYMASDDEMAPVIEDEEEMPRKEYEISTPHGTAVFGDDYVSCEIDLGYNFVPLLLKQIVMVFVEGLVDFEATQAFSSELIGLINQGMPDVDDQHVLFFLLQQINAKIHDLEAIKADFLVVKIYLNNEHPLGMKFKKNLAPFAEGVWERIS
jgi:hypothetical protein